MKPATAGWNETSTVRKLDHLPVELVSACFSKGGLALVTSVWFLAIQVGYYAHSYS